MAFRNMTKRGGLTVAVLVWAVIFSVLAWRSTFASLAGSGSWGVTTVWFSLLAIAYLVFSVLAEHYEASLFFGAVIFLPSVFFVFSPLQFVVFAIAVLLLFSGWRSIRREFRSRMELSIRRSLGSGVFVFSLSVAFLIAGSYYAVIRTASLADLVPQFSLGSGIGDSVLRVAGVFYPELARVREKNLSVDEFLGDMQASQTASVKDQFGSAASSIVGTGNLPVGVAGIRESDIDALSAKVSLDMARGEFGKLVGRTITGNEKATDVFAEALRGKLLAILSAGKVEKSLPDGALPAFLSVLVFFTVLSIAAVIQELWVLVAAGFIRLAVATGILSVKKIPAEREVLS